MSVARPESNYARLSRNQLAGLLPELLLAGQLIDRSGMAWVIAEFGRDEMAQIAIEEWMASSPIYTRRMQRALGFVGDDVVTIFKGLQLDIGAPPQFLDFEFSLTDRWHGEFRLRHCGALCDVTPMGEDYVRAMCHDIEDPTFDATALATNPRAQVRPIHRPPGVPENGPQCAWTVVIDHSHPEVEGHPSLAVIAQSEAARLDLAEIDLGQEGLSSYSGPLLDNLDFAAYSHSALVRLADEVALQSQLLNLAFRHAIARRAQSGRCPAPKAAEICEKQVVGWAGVVAERLHRFLGTESSLELVRALHPLHNPAAYVQTGLCDRDEGWARLDLSRAERAIEAAVTGAESFDEVAVTRLSSGAGFGFEPRTSLPIFVA